MPQILYKNRSHNSVHFHWTYINDQILNNNNNNKKIRHSRFSDEKVFFFSSSEFTTDERKKKVVKESEKVREKIKNNTEITQANNKKIITSETVRKKENKE